MFGLCLGSYEATIAVIRSGKAEILANEGGERSTPMMATINSNNSSLVGTQSKQAFYRNYESTAMDIMRLLGSSESDMQNLSKAIDCKVVFKDGQVHFSIPNNKTHNVTDVLSLLLKQLSVTAHLCDPVSPIPVVIATKDVTEQKTSLIRRCAQECGFSPLAIHHSSSLSLLPYGFGSSKDSFSGRILVYDMGLRTLTLSLFRSDKGMIEKIKSESYGGVGGATLDEVLLSVLKSEAERIFRKDVTQSNKRALYKMLSAAETAKHSLSSQTSTHVFIESLYDGMDFQYTLSRGKFEGMCLPLFKSFLHPVQPFIDSVGVALADINKIVLVGGTCKIPKLQQLVQELFIDSEILSSVPSEYIATLGAAMQGEYYQDFGQNNVLVDAGRIQCCPSDITVQCSSCEAGESMLLLPKHTPLPCKESIIMPLKIINDVDVVLLKVQETVNDSDSDEERLTIAEIKVPVSVLHSVNNLVKLQVDIVWRGDQLNDIHLTIKDSQSDWRTGIDL